MDDVDELLNVWVETARDYAIFLIDPAGLVASWNVGAERILGYREAEIHGQPIELFFTPEDRAKGTPEWEINEARARGRASDDRWHVRKDGSRFWCSGMLMAVRDGPGAIRGFVKVMRDLTERKQMEDQLRARAAELQEADRRKNEFLAMLSHELRNPLAPILTSVYFLRQRSPSQDPVIEQAHGMIERQVLNLKRMIDDLLDVSRMALNRIQLHPEPVDLSLIVARAIETVRPLLLERRYALTVAAEPEPIPLLADPVRLEQVLVNLLSNAAKFTDPGGTIAVATAREDGQGLIRVGDNGIGIALEMQDRVFDLFTQAEQGLDRARGGLGIGLTLARRLVELHGGTITVHSAGPGRGSEFVVRLPSTSPASKEVPASAPPGRTGGKYRVLVVDDNTDAATSLELLLKQAGFEVRCAHDGPSGLELTRQYQPDVVLLDIGLPHMNGYEVAHSIRNEMTVALVALTGYALEPSTAARFDRYLIKPVDPAELLSLLDQLGHFQTRP